MRENRLLDIHEQSPLLGRDFIGPERLRPAKDVQELDPWRKVCPLDHLAGANIEPGMVDWALDLASIYQLTHLQGSESVGPMRRNDALRTLALSSALILAFGGTGGASEEDTGDTGKPPSVEAAPPAEAPEEAADETSPPADKPGTEASESEDE